MGWPPGAAAGAAGGAPVPDTMTDHSTTAADAISRRRFLAATAGLAAGAGALGALACRPEQPVRQPGPRAERLPDDEAAAVVAAAAGRIAARPGAPTESAPTGLHGLEVTGVGEGLLLLPASAPADRPAPLLVLLHGAGGEAGRVLELVRDLAETAGLVVLVPQSQSATWDVVLGGFGPDVAAIDALLAATFDRRLVDPRRVAVGGFSDGASYALSLGLTNGDLFGRVAAFSPGFMRPGGRVGRVACFVSHGTRDTVLPIERCSRRLVPQLRREGHEVRYTEFDGPHTVPRTIAEAAVAWLVSGA